MLRGDIFNDEIQPINSELKLVRLFPKIGSYPKIPWYETIWVQLGILSFCGILLLSAIWVWRGKKKSDRATSSLAQWLIVAVSGLNLLFIFGLPLSLWWIGVWKLAYGVPAIVIALYTLAAV